MDNLDLGRRLAVAVTEGEVAFAFSPYEGPDGLIAYGELTVGIPGMSDMGQAFDQLALLPDAADVQHRLLGLLLNRVRDVGDRFLAVVSINIDIDGLTEAAVESILGQHLQPFVLLEITERAKVDDQRLQLLQRLVEAGYRLALDDLGDGAHADADYVGWLLGTGLFSVVKLDFTRTNKLAQPETFAEVEALLVPYEKTGLDLILEGAHAPREHGAWQGAVYHLRKVWKGNIFTPRAEVMDV